MENTNIMVNKKRQFFILFAITAFLALIVTPNISNADYPQNNPLIYLIKIDGSINPAASDFIHKSLKEAVDKKAECLVIELNTPGGLLKSTRYIVSDL